MISGPIRFGVYGHPQPKGSMICCRDRRHTLREDNKHTRPWMRLLDEQIRKITSTADPGQPVAVEATFTLHRPTSHYGTGRNATTVKPGSPTHPTGRGVGDVDKQLRCILDALEAGGVLPNDSQVVAVTAVKLYAGTPGALAHPGVIVTVRPHHPTEEPLL